jgi:hypothetical protein
LRARSPAGVALAVVLRVAVAFAIALAVVLAVLLFIPLIVTMPITIAIVLAVDGVVSVRARLGSHARVRPGASDQSASSLLHRHVSRGPSVDQPRTSAADH